MKKLQKFNPISGIYMSADKAYYDGFVADCMQVANTKLICETVTPPPTQPQTTQPTQGIQPASAS